MRRVSLASRVQCCNYDSRSFITLTADEECSDAEEEVEEDEGEDDVGLDGEEDEAAEDEEDPEGAEPDSSGARPRRMSELQPASKVSLPSMVDATTINNN